MTHYFARSRRSRGAYLQALFADQAKSAGVELAELVEYDEAAQAEGLLTRLLVVDQPAPARGYALLALLGTDVVVRMHVISGQPDDVYRALFSSIAAHATVGGYEASLVLDLSTMDDRTREAVTRLGEPYGLFVDPDAAAEEALLTLPEGVVPVTMQEPSGPISEAVAEQLLAGGLDVAKAAEGTETLEAVVDAAYESIEAEVPVPTEAEVDTADAADADYDWAAPEEEGPTEALACPDCDRTFTQPRYLTQHRKAKH